jgi:hypothetical protein
VALLASEVGLSLDEMWRGLDADRIPAGTR